MNALYILIALLVGLALGVAGQGSNWGETTAGIASPIGGLWLNALKMTIVPLLVSMLFTGIAQTAEAARAGKLALRSVLTFFAILWASSAMAALWMPTILNMFPLDRASGDALKTSLAAAAKQPPPQSIKEFLLSIIPTNPIDAATSNGATLPIVFFTCVFAFAAMQLPEEKRLMLTRFFEAIGETMLVMIKWVLALAPLGVFALALEVGAQSGFSALGALAHYVVSVSSAGVIVILAGYLLALIGARLSLAKFQKAALPAQALAISTQSSLACLPLMLEGTKSLGVPAAKADLILPLAVALFRATGPAMNLAVAIYVAHWYGVALGPAQLAAGLAVAAITTIGAVSLPGTLSYISSIAPIALAMGVPIEPLAILVAVEQLPDIVRTLGNVTMDTAITATIARHAEKGDTL